MPKIFFFYLFLKNFDHKTRTKLADEENASKSFDLICFYKADALSWIEFFLFFSWYIFALYWAIPSHYSKYYSQCIETKAVKFYIIAITEMEKQRTHETYTLSNVRNCPGQLTIC